MTHRKRLFISAALFALAAIAAHAAEPNPTVTVTGGQIQGRLLANGPGAVFLGIPFAQPPVGDLRWREPMPVKPWDGVRDAGSYAPPCAQIYVGKWNETPAAEGKEDCLYLDIETPEWPSKSPTPVMVWIHGGGNMAGAPNDHDWPLSRYGVITVTVQYRLGMFGFLAHPELTGESPHHASGNYGLLDQIAALQWVKQNISKFGGDPNNITVFGQSAGAYDIGYLLTSPLAKGLFSRAIQQSGAAMSNKPLVPLADAEKSGEKVVAGLKPPATGTIAYLRTLSTADILKASPPYGSMGPKIDGYSILRQSAEVFTAGQEYAVPLLLGNNAREVQMTAPPEQFARMVNAVYGPLGPAALKLYEQSSAYPPYGSASSQFATDLSFRCSAVLAADLHSSLAPVYEYEFSRTPPGSEGPLHSAELGYVFGPSMIKGMTAVDRKISADMQVYWTNFAKSGDPNSASVPVWPRHDSRSRAYIEFTDKGPVAKQDLRRQFCELYSGLLKQWLAK